MRWPQHAIALGEHVASHLQEKMSKNQREFMLREQLKSIKCWPWNPWTRLGQPEQRSISLHLYLKHSLQYILGCNSWVFWSLGDSGKTEPYCSGKSWALIKTMVQHLWLHWSSLVITGHVVNIFVVPLMSRRPSCRSSKNAWKAKRSPRKPMRQWMWPA